MNISVNSSPTAQFKSSHKNSSFKFIEGKCCSGLCTARIINPSLAKSLSMCPEQNPEEDLCMFHVKIYTLEDKYCATASMISHIYDLLNFYLVIHDGGHNETRANCA